MRRYPCGAEITEKGVSFRLWAPKCESVEIVLEKKSYFLNKEENGYFSQELLNIKPDTLYQIRVDGQQALYPDPASRFQPLGPHGPSQIIDYTKFQWSDQSWKGVQKNKPIFVYELHIGTFTAEGNWKSAKEKLAHLADLGINVIEMMPICEFCGDFNWGYDGVNLFAPTHNYGKPDDLRCFINQAHELEIAVILDVVYNHFGPEGNFLHTFSENYFKNEDTEWGRAINFDGEDSEEVRAYFISNIGYWIEEFHFDGVRFDACHALVDTSSTHILKELTEQVRIKAGKKETFVIAENEQQQIALALPPNASGYGMDALFNEDFHHAAFVRLTGKHEAYFHDYLGRAQEFVSSTKYGFLYQGQWYSWQKKNRGSAALDTPPNFFINFIENHDQIANSGGSQRLRQFSQPGAYRAMVTLLLLSPQIPLIFQGQEFGATSPFFYFSNMGKNLSKQVFKGRLQFLKQFESYHQKDVISTSCPPHEKETFLQSKLNWDEKNTFSYVYKLYKDLIQLRKNDPVFCKLHELHIDGSVFNDDAFLLRYRDQNDERLLLFNFGTDLFLKPFPEPLLAPPRGFYWTTLWASEQVKYGAFGYIKIPKKGNWYLSGNSALILYPKKLENHGL